MQSRLDLPHHRGESRASSVHVQPGHVDTGHVHELENLYRKAGKLGITPHRNLQRHERSDSTRSPTLSRKPWLDCDRGQAFVANLL